MEVNKSLYTSDKNAAGNNSLSIAVTFMLLAAFYKFPLA
jgi:hypothetical protein